jgi:hypothetical protein
MLRYIFGFALAVLLLGCGNDDPKELVPDVYRPGTPVSLNYRGQAFVLGPRSGQMFLQMLATTPLRSGVSRLPAAPMGEFIVDKKRYHWHGNAVVRGGGDRERLWYGPFTQRLIRSPIGEPADMRRVLDELERDPTLADTPLDEPGAYPGAGKGGKP